MYPYKDYDLKLN